MFIQSMISMAAIMLTSCSAAPPEPTNFKAPAKVCELPPELVEVSGLTDVDGNTVACVQDESGVVYFYDLENCSIKEKLSFEGVGDFEGLTRVGDKMYALRSDGTLFKIDSNGNEQPEIEKIDSKVPAGDNEGLAYDEKNNRLLISPKGKFDEKEMGKSYRPVYAFDLQTGKLQEEPAFKVALKDAQVVVENQLGTQSSSKKKSGKSNFSFDVASIAVHPQEDLYYLLSSTEHFILVVDGTGKPLEALTLDSKVFENPEGLTFLDNRTLVVSSEGGKRPAAIAMFDL